MKNKLNKILTQLNNQEGNQQELGYEALAIIEELLIEKPFDIDLFIIKMRINADIFENTSQVIKDATFIIENKEFGNEKLVGYDWLFSIYKDVMAMPEMAQEIIEEQLIEIQTLFDKKYKKDSFEGDLLNKFAQLKFDNNQKEEALKLWSKSFDKSPFFTQRNSFVGYLLLEEKDFNNAEKFLLKNWHLEVSGYDDFEKVKIAKKLESLLKNNELTNNPNLVGLYYNYIRNEKEAFGLNRTLDFYEKHLPELEKWGDKFPNCSVIWTAIGNCYYLDTKNYEKALEAYKTMLKGDEPYTYSIIKRVYKSAKKSKKNFLEIQLPFKGNAGEMYEMLTNLTSFAKKSKKKKEKKKYINLAIEFGEKGYNQYRDYLLNGKGDTENNAPYKFAMLCNNYAIVLTKYAKKNLTGNDRLKAYNYAGDIHMEGFRMAPFLINIENASQDYYKGENYLKAIEISKETLETYKDEVKIFDIQFNYWQIVSSYLKLNELENAEKYYFKAKKVVQEVGKGAKAGTDQFIFTGKIFYLYVVECKNIYEKYISEMEWYLKEEIALELYNYEHYLVHLLLGICYKETNQKEKAIDVLTTCYEMLYDEDQPDGYYTLKALEAKNILIELDAIKEPKKKKWGLF